MFAQYGEHWVRGGSFAPSNTHPYPTADNNEAIRQLKFELPHPVTQSKPRSLGLSHVG
jgi:hypothetical protein